MLKLWEMVCRNMCAFDGDEILSQVQIKQRQESMLLMKFRSRTPRACYCLGSLVGSLLAVNSAVCPFFLPKLALQWFYLDTH